MNGADSRPEMAIDSLYVHSFVYIQKDDVGILGDFFLLTHFFSSFLCNKRKQHTFFHIPFLLSMNTSRSFRVF